jgi:anti-anti-sigma factor
MQIDDSQGHLQCLLEGHFDTVQSQQLEAALKPRLDGSQGVVFDLQAVTYVCSGFLRVCLSVARKVGADSFRMVGVTPPIKRVFMMAGMGELLAGDRLPGTGAAPTKEQGA